MLAFEVTKRRFEAQQLGILQSHERLPEAKYQELLKQGAKSLTSFYQLIVIKDCQ